LAENVTEGSKAAAHRRQGKALLSVNMYWSVCVCPDAGVEVTGLGFSTVRQKSGSAFCPVPREL